MFKQASTLAHKIRLQQQLQQQQQQQLKAAGAAQQQQGPSSQPQAMAVQNPVQGVPSMSRGVSPALPTHSQPLLQQQLQQQQQQQKPALAASQPAQPLRQFPLGQQPAPSARAVPVSAAMSHAQHQLGIPRQPGLVPGAAPGRSPSPGVYPGAPSPVPTAGQQPQGSSLHPGLSLPQPAQQSAQQPKPKAAAHSKRVLGACMDCCFFNFVLFRQGKHATHQWGTCDAAPSMGEAQASASAMSDMAQCIANLLRITMHVRCLWRTEGDLKTATQISTALRSSRG